MKSHSLLNANALNFSGGPGALPESVLQQIQAAVEVVPELGVSILGVSHRSEWFKAVVEEAEYNIKRLLNLSDAFHVLFLQGGATQQFSMIPMSFLKAGQTADYLKTGYWSTKSIKETQYESQFNVLWSGENDGFNRLPSQHELHYNPNATYFHYTSNETVEGVQFQEVMGLASVPRICDMSSDFLSKPIEAQKFDLIYAHAQKNLGPAGVTIVVIKDGFLQRADTTLPGFLNYPAQVAAHSIYNTPPVFAIYVVLLVTRWLIDEVGGLEAMASINQKKAQLLYDYLDKNAHFYRGYAQKPYRSMMNITFKLPNAHLEDQFLQASHQAGLTGLKGHRSLGGIRASLYNGVTVEAVEYLIQFMQHFYERHSERA